MINSSTSTFFEQQLLESWYTEKQKFEKQNVANPNPFNKNNNPFSDDNNRRVLQVVGAQVEITDDDLPF